MPNLTREKNSRLSFRDTGGSKGVDGREKPVEEWIRRALLLHKPPPKRAERFAGDHDETPLPQGYFRPDIPAAF